MVIGSATLDTVAARERTAQKIGGAVTYAGFTFRLHGLDTGVLTNIAEPDLPFFRAYAETGIHLLNGATPATTRFINREGPYNRTQEMPSRADPIRDTYRLATMHSVRHIHLGPLHPDDIHDEVLSVVGRGPWFVSLDIQGYVRRSTGTRIVPEASRKLDHILPVVDAVKASEEELHLVLERFRMDIREFLARFGIGELLVTRGAKGGFLANASGDTIEYESVPVESVEDPTGAGDVFFAAYLAGRRHEEWTGSESLAHAARVAARNVAGNYIPAKWLSLDP